MKAFALAALVGGIATTTLACTVAPGANNANGSGDNGAGGAASAQGAAAAAAQGTTCNEILTCASECRDDKSCEDACVAKGSADAKTKVDALSKCFETNQCNDAACVQSKCSAELNACIAQKNPAPANSTAPSNAPAGSVSAELVGKWYSATAHGNSSYEFRADGTMIHATHNEMTYGCVTITDYVATGTAVVAPETIKIYEEKCTISTVACGQPANTGPSPSSTGDYGWRFETDPSTGEKVLYLKTAQYGEAAYRRM